VLEVAYVEQRGSPFTSFCLFEQGNKCLDDFAQQQPNYYKLVGAFNRMTLLYAALCQKHPCSWLQSSKPVGAGHTDCSCMLQCALMLMSYSCIVAAAVTADGANCCGGLAQK
jgi:hypothetical protein